MAEFAVAIQPTFEIFKHIIGWFSTGLQFLNKWTKGFGGLALLIGGALALSFVKAAGKALIMNTTLAARIPILAAIAAEWATIAAAKAAAGEGGGTVGGFGKTGSMMGGMTGSTKRMLMGAGLKVGAVGGGIGVLSTMMDEGRGFNTAGVLGGAASGAGMGASIGTMILPGVGTAIGAGIGAIGGGLLSWFHDGGGVGGTGDTPAMVQGGEAVVPIQRTPAAENLASMVAERSGGGDNTAVVAAINAQTQAIVAAIKGSGDYVLTIGKTEVGRVINQHLGEPGSAPLRLKTA